MAQSVKNLTVEDLDNLNPQDFQNPEVLNQIEKLSLDSMYDYEPGLAAEFHDSLSTAVEKLSGQLDNKLNLALVRLSWQGLSALGKKNRTQALASGVILAIKNNLNIIGYLEKFLDIFEFPLGPNDEQRQAFLFALNHNQEILGPKSLTLKSGEKVNSYISNWIKDYVSYVDPNSLRGPSYELTQYLFSSPNANSLNSSDKDLLSKVISIYNFLRYGRSVPVPEGQLDTDKAEVLRRATAPKIRIMGEHEAAVPESLPTAEFKRNVANVSAGPMPAHGQDLEVLRRQMAPPQPSVKMTPQEITREVGTRELTGSTQAPQVSAPGPVSRPMPPPVPRAPVAIGSLKSLSDISALDDLKKITLGNLRQGPPQSQLQLVKAKMISLAQANRLLPYYAVNAFEQSPLFKEYLAHGKAGVEGFGEQGQMTRGEFEAIADLRKEVERL